MKRVYLKIILVMFFTINLLSGNGIEYKRYEQIANHFLTQKSVYMDKEKEFLKKEGLKLIPFAIKDVKSTNAKSDFNASNLKNIIFNVKSLYGKAYVVKKKDGLYIYLLRKNNSVPIIFKDMKF